LLERTADLDEAVRPVRVSMRETDPERRMAPRAVYEVETFRLPLLRVLGKLAMEAGRIPVAGGRKVDVSRTLEPPFEKADVASSADHHGPARAGGHRIGRAVAALQAMGDIAPRERVDLRPVLKPDLGIAEVRGLVVGGGHDVDAARLRIAIDVQGV